MKKKYLLSLLVPLLLTSCGKSGVSFSVIKGITDELSNDMVFPYYHVEGILDFNNEITEVSATFDKNPRENEFVPYARYNEGFYLPSIDMSESKVENIKMYNIGSRSYWLRAPLRLTKDNFYILLANNLGSGTYMGMNFAVNYDNGRIGAIGPEISNAKVAIPDVGDVNKLRFTYTKNETEVNKIMTRQGALSSEVAIYNGTWKSDDGEVITLVQTERANRTCAHSIIESIVTSYKGQSSSINPSSNNMTYELLSDGGFAFVGNKVHTNLKIDNYPYYPDPASHPELEWSEDDPLPCFKNTVNAKVNIRLEYNKDGWLTKETMTSIGYSYTTPSDSQVSLTAVYTYKFA